jgi:hypothetical protein
MYRLMTLLALLAALTGCASYPDTSPQRAAALSQHYNQFDLRLSWDTRQVGGHTVVEGIAKNVRWAYMYDLEIWVALLDPSGRELAKNVGYVIPRQLNQDQSAPFSVKLAASAAPGSTLRFSYQYRGSDGGDNDSIGDGGTLWRQSFDAVVPR